MKYLLLALTLICSLTFGFSQDETVSDQDVVILVNHTKIEGDILEVNKRWVVIKVGSVPFSFAKNRIRSIIYDGQVISMMTLKDKNKENQEAAEGFYLVPVVDTEKRGFYNITSGGILFRDRISFFSFESSGLRGSNGYGIYNVSGHQFSQHSGIGIGLGFQTQGVDDELKIFSINAEYRGYLSKNKISAFYSLGYGAVFAVKNEDSGFESSKPGSYFYPAFGFKSGSNEGAITVDLGLRVASVTLNYENNRGIMNEEKESLNGVVLRIGVML